LAGGRRPRSARIGRLIVGTRALAGGRRTLTPASGRLTVGTHALAGGRRTLTPATGRLMPESWGLAGRRGKRVAARRNGTWQRDALRLSYCLEVWRRPTGLRRGFQHRIDTPRNAMVLLGMARGGTMPNDMGSFRVDVELENPARPGQRRTVRSVLVDTGAELSWV